MKFGNAVARFPQDRINEAERGQMTRPFLIAAGLLAPIGLVSVLANWESRANAASTMVFDAATGYSVNTSGNGYFDDAQLLLAPLTVLCVWLYRFKWWTFIPLVGFLILRGGTGGRWPIIMASISIALLYLYERRRRWPEWKAAAFGGLALFLFQVIGADRGTSIRTLFIEDRSGLARSWLVGPLPRRRALPHATRRGPLRRPARNHPVVTSHGHGGLDLPLARRAREEGGTRRGFALPARS